MKLLKLKIDSQFRSLPAGFSLKFREDNFEDSDVREPICLVGLNGSGKSNSLELICEIFYYVELQTIASTSELKKLEERYHKLAFEIEYLISEQKWKFAYSRIQDSILKLNSEDKVIVKCNKQKNQPLEISLYSFDYSRQHDLKRVNWVDILPSKIIGYSSGQNELISNAFIKLDYYYFDKFESQIKDNNLLSISDVNRMFFMDYESNELIVLANYLFHDIENNRAEADETEFDKLNKKLKIKQLKSFSIKLGFKDYKEAYINFPPFLGKAIEDLKSCASIKFDNEEELLKEVDIKIQKELDKLKTKSLSDSATQRIRNSILKNRKIELVFYSDFAIKKAFRHYFKSPYELFKILYLLRLHNIYCQSLKTRDAIKGAPQGTNLSNLIPKPAVDDLVFKIDEIEFEKNNMKTPVTYKQLSDGEHQLLHVMGTLNLMNENDVLFILDEPETHFNPEWRARMIKMIINNSTPELEQDYFITSHSPFIISDCKPNNVYIFNKTAESIKVETAAKRKLNTFGTSVNILTDEIFNKNESIADYSLFKLNEIKNRRLTSLKAIQKAKEDSRLLGESVEKVLLFRKLITLEDIIKEKELAKQKLVKKISLKSPKTKLKAPKKVAKAGLVKKAAAPKVKIKTTLGEREIGRTTRKSKENKKVSKVKNRKTR